MVIKMMPFLLTHGCSEAAGVVDADPAVLPADAGVIRRARCT